jgi:hypothetical protein
MCICRKFPGGTGVSQYRPTESFMEGQFTEVEVDLWPTISRPVCLGVGLLSGAHDQIFVFWLTLRISCCEAPFLMGGCVCDLLIQLLLSLSRAMTLGSESRRTQTIFCCLIWDSPNLVKSQSHITIDSQSASPSWCQAPIWDPRPIFLCSWDFLLDSCSLLFYRALSDERTGL